MPQTQPSRSKGMKRSSCLLLISLFVFCNSFSQTTIFTTQTPVATTNNDHQPTVGHEVGVKFTSSAAGSISGIRFYKTSGNSGTHIGELYSSNGTRLAQATFVNETATGWQTVLFSSPVAITANTSYTAAYFSSLGNYTEDNNYFKGHSVTNSPLTAPADGTNGASGGDPGNGQGVYAYSASPGFPNQLYKSANYWVDVIFNSVSSVIANAGDNQLIKYPNNELFLSGILSTGNITSYSWTLVSGPNIPVFTTPGAASTTVTGFVQGIYVFQLSLNGGQSKSQVTYTVKYLPPVASAGSNKTIVLPLSAVSIGTYTLDILAGNDQHFSWTQISGPNTASIINSESYAAEVFGLIQGVYVFQQYAFGPGAPGVDSARITVTVLPPGLSPNIFTTQIPTEGSGNMGQGIEVGVKFQSSLAGYITGLRFYKSAGNTGTHTGELYASDGTRLAQAVFSNETATGWQTVSFSSPVSVAANTTYVAAYYSSAGNFTSTANYFKNATVNNPLTAIADGYDGPNGIFSVGTSPHFPTGAQPNTNNYWVDVVYTNSNGSLKADAGPNQEIYASQATVSASASTGNITSYKWSLIFIGQGFLPIHPDPVITAPNSATTTITGLYSAYGKYGDDEGYFILQLSLNGGASVSQITIHVLPSAAYAGPDQTITQPTDFVLLNGDGSSGINKTYAWTEISGPNTANILTPAEIFTTVTGMIPGTYLFQLTLNGGATSSQVTVIVKPAVTLSGSGIFTSQTPAATTDNDHKPTVGQELGVKFTSATDGQIIGFRFYKTSGNNGIHTGELYSSAGVRLAQAEFTNESTSGWQSVTLSTPVTITANTTYTAAYFSSLGNYTEDNDYFLHHSVTNNSLTAAADGTNGSSGTDPGNGQGVYKYSSSPVFPDQLYRSANYWVDVIFSPGFTTPIADAGAFQTITLPTSSVTLDGSHSKGNITSYKWTLVNTTGSTPIINSPNNVTTTVTGLTPGFYNFQLAVNGNASVSQVTVQVLAAIISNVHIFTNQVPTASTDNDHRPTVGQEVGVKFSTSLAGNITAIRFYKTAGNTGTHIGELYAADGTRLAQATFINETATGWQTAVLSQPVLIPPGTSFTAAYFSSLGNYTEDNDYFLHHTEVNNLLTAPEDGTNGAGGTDPGTGQGVYKYTSSPAFPNQLYRSANYWVDVTFNSVNNIFATPPPLAEAKAVDVVTDSSTKVSYFLGQNYPNPVPMSLSTKIEYGVPIASKVELVLYDIQGRPVKIMVNEMKNAGRYSYDLNTGVLAKGLYIYSIHSGTFHDVKKLVVQ